MKVFYANDPDSKQFEEILFWFHKYMDGSVSSKMEQNGLHYQVNNGVSVVHLRRFASQLECSPQLIMRLWNSNIREGMILATLLFDETILTTESDLIKEKLTNNEMSEQFAFNLGYKAPQICHYYMSWLANSNEDIQIAAILSVSVALQRKVDLNSDDLILFLNAVVDLDIRSHSFERSITRMFVGMLSNVEIRGLISNLIQKWEVDQNLAKRRIANEVAVELQYLNN